MTSDRIYRFYQQGRCTKGDKCFYKHEGSSAAQKDKKPPCREFLKKGSCKYGENCTFSHSAAGAPKASAEAKKKAKAKANAVAVCIEVGEGEIATPARGRTVKVK